MHQVEMPNDGMRQQFLFQDIDQAYGLAREQQQKQKHQQQMMQQQMMQQQMMPASGGIDLSACHKAYLQPASLIPWELAHQPQNQQVLAYRPA
jgi:hypothetical protein